MASAVWDVTRSLPASSLMQITDFAPFIHGLDHPEGVACGPNGEPYAGGEAGQIYQVTLNGSFQEIGSTGGFVLGLCLGATSPNTTWRKSRRPAMSASIQVAPPTGRW
jgi:hypothetical protein